MQVPTPIPRDLMYGDAAQAKEVAAKAKPPMTREQYLAFQRSQSAKVDYDGAKG